MTPAPTEPTHRLGWRPLVVCAAPSAQQALGRVDAAQVSGPRTSSRGCSPAVVVSNTGAAFRPVQARPPPCCGLWSFVVAVRPGDLGFQPPECPAALAGAGSGLPAGRRPGQCLIAGAGGVVMFLDLVADPVPGVQPADVWPSTWRIALLDPRFLGGPAHVLGVKRLNKGPASGGPPSEACLRTVQPGPGSRRFTFTAAFYARPRNQPAEIRIDHPAREQAPRPA